MAWIFLEVGYPLMKNTDIIKKLVFSHTDSANLQISDPRS